MTLRATFGVAAITTALGLSSIQGCSSAASQEETGAGGGAGSSTSSGDPFDAGTGGGSEICDNGFDDDGNGVIDDGCPCTIGAQQNCYRGPLATRSIGACHDGVQLCVPSPHSEVHNGVWGPCDGDIDPVNEACNGLDDNCNGAVDEGCGSGSGGGGGGGGQDICHGGSPIQPGNPNILEVKVGGTSACARRASGEVLCWGANDVGQLGDGTSFSSLIPVVVKGLTDAVKISVSQGQACALKSDGTVVCWGQLDLMTKSNVPVAIAGLQNEKEIAAGYGHTNCAVSCDGTVACWGSNVMGKVGIGVDDGKFYASPQPVLGISAMNPAIGVASGYSNTCATLASGGVLCWGDESFWMEGGGTLVQPTPTPVPGVSNAIQSTTNLASACAVTKTGEVVCWGDNNNGILGVSGCPNAICQASQSGISVVGLSNVAQVAVGDNDACARATDGTVSCWGAYPNPFHPNPSPILIGGLNDLIDITVGTLNTYCGVHASGGVSCWGRGTEGQLGDGMLTNSMVPVSVVNLP
jgi:hypothetical protein